MELTCPACSARYAVPVTAIPASGRVVRCSNCHAEWKATPPTTRAAAPPPAQTAAPQMPAQTAAPQMPETTREPATPMPEPAPPAEDAPTAPEPQASEPEQGIDAPRDALVAQRQARAEQGDAAHVLAMSLDDETPARQGGGFLAGFAAVTLLALASVTVYIKHGEIGAAFPPLDAPLQRYAALVDEGRVALAEAVVRLREGG